MTYDEWQQRHPTAAAELAWMLTEQTAYHPSSSDGKSEAWSQQQDRLTLAKAGAMAWRNNVGATPAKCPDCQAPQRPVRYGLANDSAKLNKRVKSSDLICCIPRHITPDMVGQTIGQFGAIESKRPGWTFAGTERENAQAAFHAIVLRLHGFATFSTGNIQL